MTTETTRRFSLLTALGISFPDCVALRRISMTLSRWDELECGDGNDYASWSIERDEKTGLPYLVTHPHKGPTRRTRIPDREKGAEKRLAATMARYPALASYRQTDPRGASLYVGPRADMAVCYTRGIAITK